MVCKHCKMDNDDNAVVCVHCGKKMTSKSKIPTWVVVLLWIFVLPVMLIITIAKSEKLTRNTKIILIAVIVIFSLFFGMINSKVEDSAEKTTYETIIKSIEVGKYEEAQGLITEFIKQYPDSEYLSEISSKKDLVDSKVLEMQNESKTEHEGNTGEEKKTEKLNAEYKKNAQKAGVSVDAFKNMLDACEVIDIEYKKISNITSKDDWAYGKRCSFYYNGYQFLVYFNQDETVNSINIGTTKFYENGEKVKDLNSIN